jgi:peptidoglycan/LPS O-acetylase OafA/YrhL
MKQNKLPTKGSFNVKVALIWATPMIIFFCWLFWKFGALSVGSALALICLCVVLGVGYGAFVHRLVEKRSAKDSRRESGPLKSGD